MDHGIDPVCIPGPIDLSALDPDMFVFAGHKGPFGPQGIGGLYISDRVSMQCPSAACEVTPGSKKASIFPTYCDTGSAPMQAIAGLTAGIEWLEVQGWDRLLAHRTSLVEQLRSGLDQMNGIELIGSSTYGRFTGAVSITSSRVPLEQVKQHLSSEYGIRGSYGFQCAPLAHEAMGTADSGTLRFSVGPMNTSEEIEILLMALQKLTG